MILLSRNKSTIALFASVSLFIFATSAHALPSFARQTGEACTACHVQTWGANLTPRGRDFKLKGYTEGDASSLPPLSLVVQGGGVFDLNGIKNPYNNSDGSRSNFGGSLFYAGKVYDHLGAYVEGTYALDPETGWDTGFLNKVDLRFANQVDVAGHHVDYGISINNEPGVQDLWNTNAVWNPLSIAYLSSPSGIDFMPLADRGLSGHVAGATLYTLVNKLLYIEAGGYASLPNDVQRGIGRDNYGFNSQIDGAAPYWRIALQHNWDGHYLSLGHFGLQADTTKNRNTPLTFLSNSNDVSYSDLGLDATYQYLANPDHIFEFKGRYLRETRATVQPDFNFFHFGGITPNNKKIENTTESFNVNGAYTWLQTIGASVGYHQYGLPFFYSKSGIDAKFVATELSYTPFGKQHSLASPWLNLRLNLGYIININNPNLAQSSSDSLYLNGRLAF